MQILALHSYLPFWSLRLLCKWVSVTPTPGSCSLPGMCPGGREQAPWPHCSFLPLLGLGHTARPPQLAMLGAPSVGPPPASVCCSRSKRTGVVQDLCAVQPCGAGLQHPAGCCWEACSQPCEQGKARAPAGLVPSGYRKCNSFLQSGGARGTQEGPSFCTPSELNLLPPNPTRGGSVQIPSQSQLVSTAHSVSARGGASPCSSS